jgi:ABC-type branched-subunit amino acid transport system substrate-binding protein
MLSAARAALEAERAGEAAATARRVVEGYPTTRSSGDAALLLARALEARGDADGAASAVRLYREALGPMDPRRSDALLREARLRAAAGRPAPAIRLLLEIPADAPDSVRADGLRRIRGNAAELDRETLESLLESTPLGQPLRIPLAVEYARSLRLAGREEEARRYARVALDEGATGPDRAAARRLLGETADDDTVEPVRLGALLPVSGSPALREYARAMRRGAEAAVHASGLPGVELAVADDAGDPGRAADVVRSPGPGAPVVGWIGPLTEDALDRAASARSGRMPLVSPTAQDTRGLPSVYSLQGFDPGSARTLAEYAAGSGLDVVVVIHPDEPGPAYEARVFEERFTELRGSVLRTLTYPPGATYFEEQLRAAEVLRPDALVLPIPARDIEALAPQVSFFGLDTLGVNVLGTADWALDPVLESVSPRHTDGVVVATPRPPGSRPPGFSRFQAAYEERFQESVRDPLPALGYDAAALLLLALETGARSPERVRAALERVRDFQGATGTLSVEEGSIRRAHELVCLQNRESVPVEPGEVSVHVRPTRPGDPDEGEPERVPAGPLEIYCPGTVRPASAMADTLPEPL